MVISKPQGRSLIITTTMHSMAFYAEHPSGVSVDTHSLLPTFVDNVQYL